jgi:hypothetical protein
MIEPTLHHLIETVIDSPVKLHLLLIFHAQPRNEVSAASMAERACRDIWSVSEALDELAADGALVRLHAANGHALYRYQPAAPLVEPILALLRAYDDPMKRDTVQKAIRASADYAPFRRAAAFERYAAA